MFRTQLASTISAARYNPAPTFWAADASSTTPAPLQAYAGSLQPSRQNSLTLFVFSRVTQKGRVNHEQDNQKCIPGCHDHGRSLRRQRFRPAIAKETQPAAHV
jgi:hypothetical protein